MTDRELLELAAKAIGIKLRYNSWGNRDARQPWDPLTDDGDALRLVVFLGLMVRCYHNRIVVEGDLASVDIEIGQCRYHTTRRAIVKAAAQIGGDL